MSHARLKFAVAGAVVALAAGFLAFTGVREGRVYYMTVDSFLADQQYHSQRVRLIGRVSPERFHAGGGSASFLLVGEKATAEVAVAYSGVVPDLFTPGIEAVVQGRLEGGVFRADVLLTKCASKYRPEPPASQPEGRE